MPIRFVRHFLLALQFFTRIPVTGRVAQWVGFSPAMLRASAAYLPAVGWVVGALTAAIFAGCLMVLPPLPASPWVAAVLSVAFSVGLTGAFHEDGLADTADGLGGGLTRERALEIMKDSRIGTYGAVALLLALGTKLGLMVLLAQIGMVSAVMGIFAAHVTSRLMPLFLIRTMVHVGSTPTSKSKPLAEGIGNAGVIVGFLWWGAAMVLINVWQPAAPLFVGTLVSALAALGMAWRLQRRLQGFTGDGLGATQQVAEIGFLLGLALAANPA
jgi:adenosylcobinamide-GDP ribazoletransferase